MMKIDKFMKKHSKTVLNEKGFALVTTLVLSVVALGFIMALMYMVTSSTQQLSSVKVYKSSLEVAKGASEFLTAGITDDQLGCADNITSVEQFISKYKSETDDYSVDLLNYSCRTFDNGKKALYLFEIQVNRGQTQEKTIIEFGYLEEFTD